MEIKIDSYKEYYKSFSNSKFSILYSLKELKTIEGINEFIDIVNKSGQYAEFIPIEKYEEEIDIELQKKDLMEEITMRSYIIYIRKVALAKSFKAAGEVQILDAE